MFPPLSPSPVKFSEARRAMRSAPTADQQQQLEREDDAHDGGSVANPFATAVTLEEAVRKFVEGSSLDAAQNTAGGASPLPVSNFWAATRCISTGFHPNIASLAAHRKWSLGAITTGTMSVNTELNQEYHRYQLH